MGDRHSSWRLTPNPALQPLARAARHPRFPRHCCGRAGMLDIGLIGYIKRELCPALTQQELRNSLVIHRANGLRWHADRLEAAGNWAPRQQRAQRHVRALATCPASHKFDNNVRCALLRQSNQQLAQSCWGIACSCGWISAEPSHWIRRIMVAVVSGFGCLPVARHGQARSPDGTSTTFFVPAANT